jgi:hypothetical protein
MRCSSTPSGSAWTCSTTRYDAQYKHIVTHSTVQHHGRHWTGLCRPAFSHVP